MARRSSLKRKKQKDVKTELGKYSSKYALTELLVCGRCGTSYRRSVWSKNGKKKAVWRCISRLEYGKKYCPDSPTIEESAIHRAVMNAIQEVANDDNAQTALKNLQIYIRMYYGDTDEYSTAGDELRLNNLKEMIMQEAANGDPTSERILSLSREVAELKKVIAEKQAKQTEAGANGSRMSEVLTMLDALKNHPIDYDDRAARQLIDCIKVISKDILEITFKGGIVKTMTLD